MALSARETKLVQMALGVAEERHQDELRKLRRRHRVDLVVGGAIGALVVGLLRHALGI